MPTVALSRLKIQRYIETSWDGHASKIPTLKKLWLCINLLAWAFREADIIPIIPRCLCLHSTVLYGDRKEGDAQPVAQYLCWWLLSSHLHYNTVTLFTWEIRTPQPIHPHAARWQKVSRTTDLLHPPPNLTGKCTLRSMGGPDW